MTIPRSSMIRKRILGLALIGLLSSALCPVVHAQEVKLYPVDEASGDPSFKRFRDRLIAALKRRDRKFLLSIVHPQIGYSFGGDSNVKGFVEYWDLNAPNSQLWSELLTVLSLGGSFVKENGQKSFDAPYVFSRWETIEGKLPRDFDDFCCGAVIGSKVKMHGSPDATTPVLALLSYDVVQVNYEGSVPEDRNAEGIGWVKIKTLKGQEGYVSKKLFRSPTDYRATFKKIRGKWIMTSLVAGD